MSNEKLVGFDILDSNLFCIKAHFGERQRRITLDLASDETIIAGIQCNCVSEGKYYDPSGRNSSKVSENYDQYNSGSSRYISYTDNMEIYPYTLYK